MPYITNEERVFVDVSDAPINVGQLNYKISTIIWQYYKEHPRYQSVNDVLGALEGAKLEFYRRVAAPYEDKKIVENGDVYV